MMLLEFYVEEPSAEVALIHLVPAILGDAAYEFEVHPFQGKYDLLKNLPDRLKACRYFPTDDYRVIVLVDRDDDDCLDLKAQLEQFAQSAGLKTKTQSPNQFVVVNRIVIEELEAWFFGDAEAIHAAYPRIPATLGEKAAYRDPDAIRGGTWERLEQELKAYHPGGLEKIRAADEISQHMDPDRNRSKSFQVFRDTLRRLVSSTNP